MDAREIIEKLDLRPHPEEGGFYIETYRCDEKISASALPQRYSDDRSFGTSIYYLLTPETFSSFHRLAGDEIFHFYAGDPVKMINIYPDGGRREIILGSDIMNGHVFQHVVPSGVWQGACLIEDGR